MVFGYNPIVLHHKFNASIDSSSLLFHLFLIGWRRNGAVRIQNHLSTTHHCNQQKQTQQGQEEESKAQIHIDVQSRHLRRKVHDWGINSSSKSEIHRVKSTNPQDMSLIWSLNCVWACHISSLLFLSKATLVGRVVLLLV